MRETVQKGGNYEASNVTQRSRGILSLSGVNEVTENPTLGGNMNLKNLLLICFVALSVMVITREATAITLSGGSISCTTKVACPPGSTNFVCFCLGSVDGAFEADATQLTGNSVTQTIFATDGVVACGTSGNQLASSGVQLVNDPNPESFSQSTTIQKSQIVNGTSAIGFISADISDADLQRAADAVCKNDNWVGLDYAMCAGTVRLDLKDGTGDLRASKQYSCSLDCSTLGFTIDPVAKTFSFNPEPYSCVEQ
jgi:hypothetical protein